MIRLIQPRPYTTFIGDSLLAFITHFYTPVRQYDHGQSFSINAFNRISIVDRPSQFFVSVDFDIPFDDLPF